LRAGDRLEIFNIQGDCVFDGILEPTDHREGLWSREGVDKKPGTIGLSKAIGQQFLQNFSACPKAFEFLPKTSSLA
jgi:hypothetical protein